MIVRVFLIDPAFKRRLVRRFWLFGVVLSALCMLLVASAACNYTSAAAAAAPGS